MAERIYLQLFHSDVPGAVPTAGLKIGELGLNVADNLQFVGYGGDVNYDINGDPLPDLPPEGMGWKTVGIGGGGPPGPPGPEGAGVPPGGDFGQYLRKAAAGDYVTVWDDGPPPADRDERGLVYGNTSGSVPNNNVALGYLTADDNSTRNSTAVGWSAGSLSSGSQDNVFVGYMAGYNIDGNRNVVLGSGAAGSNPGGGSTGNVIIGYQSGYNVTSANFNTLVGPTAGYNIRTGDNNTIIGGYDGSADLQGNVVLSDGAGTVRFQASDTGAWSPNGLDYGQPGYLLTSNGPDQAPEWKEAPLALVSQIIAGDNITITPPDGLGVVTINAAGGGGGSNITALTGGVGITLYNSAGVPVSTLTGPGTIEIDETQVLTPGLYAEAGSILIGGFGSGGVTALAPGSAGQVLAINPSNGFPYWANPTGTTPATPTVAGIVYGRTDGALTKNVTLGLNAGAALLGGGTANVFIGTAAGSNINTGDNNVIIGNFAGTSNLQGNIVLADGAGNVRLQTNSSGALSFDGTNYGTSGYVLSSRGPGQSPEWVSNTNAPIQTISAGAGISATPSGTDVEIANTGVISLQDGTGTTVQNVGGGVWQVNTAATAGVSKIIAGANVSISPTTGIGEVTISAAGGGGGGSITSIAGGTGISIQSPTGPVVTVNNTGVTRLVAGSNVTLSGETGQITISAAGGGSGTVTSIGTGPGLTGGPITSNGTIGVDQTYILTKNAFGNNGSFVYWDGSFQELNPPTTDIGNGVYSLGVTSAGLPIWNADYTTKIYDGDGTTAQMGGFTAEKGAFRVNLNYTELSNRYVPKNLYATVGGILYTSAANTPSLLTPGAQGQILTVGAGGLPVWAANSASVDVTAPITKTGSTIGFDVNTTSLTSYIPKSAYTATGALLVGSGVGTYTTLGPGANGEFLGINSSGALEWQTPPTPPELSLTPADDSITMTPSPITGTGTIGVTPGKFIESAVPGPNGWIVANQNGIPSRFSPSTYNTPTGAVNIITQPGAESQLVFQRPKWKTLAIDTGSSTDLANLGEMTGNACYLGGGLHDYYSYNTGNTFIGYNAKGWQQPISNPPRPSNQVQLYAGGVRKLMVNEAGAIGIGENGNCGTPGYVLMSNGYQSAPSWVGLQNSTGAGVTERTTLLNYQDQNVLINTAGLTYVKFVVTVACREWHSPNDADYTVCQWIDEYEWYYLPSPTPNGSGSQSVVTKIRQIASNGAPASNFFYRVYVPTGGGNIFIQNNNDNGVSGRQYINYTMTYTNRTPILSPY